MKPITILLMSIGLFAAEAPKAEVPKLTAEQKLNGARLQAAFYRAQADSARVEAQVSAIPEVKSSRDALSATAKAYQAFLGSLKLGDGCDLDDKQEVRCPEPKKEAAKK